MVFYGSIDYLLVLYTKCLAWYNFEWVKLNLSILGNLLYFQFGREGNFKMLNGNPKHLVEKSIQTQGCYVACWNLKIELSNSICYIYFFTVILKEFYYKEAS